MSAHPRACGENPSNASPRSFECGSSPRMRGKLLAVPLVEIIHRLIPAHAGKTATFFVSMLWYGAHPRACGENFQVALCETREAGSSPRMRGKRIITALVPILTRLIPAHAGKTGCCRDRRPRHGAHPRACGENACSGRLRVRPPGSSPRMRGKRYSLPPAS